MKGGDDLRQELLASQLVRQFKAIFDEARLPLWLRPYEILVTGSNSGMQVVGIRCMCEAGVGTLSQALFKVRRMFWIGRCGVCHTPYIQLSIFARAWIDFSSRSSVLVVFKTAV